MSDYRNAAQPREGSFLRAAMWMVGLSILLFWLPVAGPLIAGFVGGRFASSVGQAVVAGLVPAILIAGLVWLALGAFDLAVLGFLAGAGVFVVMLIQDIPLILGAAAGAALR